MKTRQNLTVLFVLLSFSLPPALSQPTQLLDNTDNSKTISIGKSLNEFKPTNYNKKLGNQLLAKANAEMAKLHVSNAKIIYTQVIANADQPTNSGETFETCRLKSYALCRLGDILATKQEYRQSINSYDSAIKICNSILINEPNSIYSATIKSIALIGKGRAQKALGNSKASESYEGAIKVCDEGLTILPENASLYLQKGNALMAEGDLLSSTSYTDKAISSFDQSQKSFDQFLEYYPASIDCLNNKSICLRKLGDLQNRLLHGEEALTNLKKAISLDDQILRKDPNHRYAKKNKKLAIRALTKTQTNSGP